MDRILLTMKLISNRHYSKHNFSFSTTKNIIENGTTKSRRRFHLVDLKNDVDEPSATSINFAPLSTSKIFQAWLHLSFAEKLSSRKENASEIILSHIRKNLFQKENDNLFCCTILNKCFLPRQVLSVLFLKACPTKKFTIKHQILVWLVSLHPLSQA